MPINYKEYHPKWSLISRLIRFARAKNRCEWCGLRNGEYVIRKPKGIVFKPDMGRVHEIIHRGYTYNQAMTCVGATKVVLTVAHLDHDKTNNRFSNLAALCQRCHLQHDIKQHVANKKYGRNHKGPHQTKLL
jgi:hypothetical protein